MVRTLILLAGLFLVACGEDGDAGTPSDDSAVEPTAESERIETDDVIRLPDGNYTEQDIRQFTNVYIDSLGLGYYCNGYLNAEADADLLAYVKQGSLQSEASKPNDHIRLVSQVDDADFLLFGKITQEECRAASE